MNQVETGKYYEEKALLFLEKQGFFVLERNFRCRQGEIDIIGIHEECLVFVEVKYRKNRKKGSPEEAVGLAKQQKICAVSDYYRSKYADCFHRQVRYDVVAITGDSIEWYKNAFFYRSKNSTRRSW